MLDSSPDLLNRFELFILGDGEKKVTEAADTRMHPTHSSISRRITDQRDRNP